MTGNSRRDLLRAVGGGLATAGIGSLADCTDALTNSLTGGGGATTRFVLAPDEVIDGDHYTVRYLNPTAATE